MRKSLILLVCLVALAITPAQANISGSGTVGGFIATRNSGFKEVKTTPKAEMQRLRSRVKELSAENKKLKNSRNRNLKVNQRIESGKKAKKQKPESRWFK